MTWTDVLGPFASRARVTQTRSRPSLQWVSLIGLAVFWILVGQYEIFGGLQLKSILLLLSAFWCGVVVQKSWSAGPWSLPFLSFFSVVVFHVGLFFSPALGNPVPDHIAIVEHSWWTSGDIERVVDIVALGIVSFSIAVSMGSRRLKVEWRDEARQLHRMRWLANLGAVCVINSVLFWIYINIENSGGSFYQLNYVEYLASVEGTAVEVAYFGIGIGITLVAMNLRAPLPIAGTAAFGVFVVLAFPMGLRGEVLMPLTAAAAVFAYGRPPTTTKVFWIGVVAILSVISVGRQVREVGVGMLKQSPLDWSPIGSLEELGYSVRVVATSVQWHGAQNEPFAHGRTYWTPFMRLLQSLFGMQKTPADTDYGLMNVEISDRVDTIGGSIIGEAHHNFGALGVIIIMFLWGLLIRFAYMRVRSAASLAGIGVISILFLMHVRNAFTAVPLWLVSGIAMVAIGLLLAGMHRNNDPIAELDRNRIRKLTHLPIERG